MSYYYGPSEWTGKPLLRFARPELIRSQASESVKLWLCRAPSCTGVSFTVAMAGSRQSCTDVSDISDGS